MAIRKREPVVHAEIEAFGAAAEVPNSDSGARTNSTTPLTSSQLTETPKSSDENRVPKTFLIRWGNDSDLAAELAEIAQLEDRSQHKIAIRALRRGLAAMREESHS